MSTSFPLYTSAPTKLVPADRILSALPTFTYFVLIIHKKPHEVSLDILISWIRKSRISLTNPRSHTAILSDPTVI